ncbi:MAG TPA: FAD:protein FMN transferase [Vicinamibacteria bacterium]|nr:FAD:protein FMN transferase [Vicinamibacteria bacterium]
MEGAEQRSHRLRLGLSRLEPAARGLGLVAVLVLVPGASSAGTTREMRVVMGTMAEVRVSGTLEPAPFIGSAFARIEETEASLSLWVEGSEISRLNEAGDAVLSELAFHAVIKSLEIARASNGAFDPTLVANGYEKVDLDHENRRVRLGAGMKLDLGGIAKGYAVDRALAELEGSVPSALVDIGTSSIALFGHEAVTFEIRDPTGRAPPASFRLCQGAIGSSSRDQWGDHIEDPRTGQPPSGVSAVTVVSPSALEADALATAVFVLGVDSGLALVASRGSDAVALVEEEGRRVLWTTPGFAERYALELAEGIVMRVRSSPASEGRAPLRRNSARTTRTMPSAACSSKKPAIFVGASPG